MAVFQELILLRDLGPALATIGDVFPELVVGALQKTARESKTILALTTRDTEPYAPIDTGAYLRAWQPINRDDGADIVNDVRQAAPLEYGTRPYWVSEEGRHRIAEWVMRKSRFARRKSAVRKRRYKVYKAGVNVLRGRGGAKQAAPGPKKGRFSKTAFGGSIARANERGGLPAAAAAAERIAWSIVVKYAEHGQKPGRRVLERSWPKIVHLAELNIDEALERAAAARYGGGGHGGGGYGYRSKGRPFRGPTVGARIRHRGGLW